MIPKNVSSIDAVRYVLRRKGSSMTLLEIQEQLRNVFGKHHTVHVIQANANRLPDGLIVEAGAYDLYENFHMSECRFHGSFILLSRILTTAALQATIATEIPQQW